MPFTKKSQVQLTVLSILLIFVILIYTVRIYSLQIVDAAQYSTRVDGVVSIRKAVIKAPRGEILDCYGRQIAVNRDGYNVVFNKAYVGEDLNDVILTLVNLLGEHTIPHVDELPMEPSAPYAFTADEKAVEKLIKTLGLAHYASPDNCFVRMSEKYDLKKYSDEDKRKIMGVRYCMDIFDFSISYPYTFAEDIPTELMRLISESKLLLSGVSVDVVPFRQYVDTSLAVNLIGSVGPIFEDDWEEYRKKGYSFSDKIGKSGIELWGEEYLHGTDGEISYGIDAEGNIVSSEITKAPVSGKTIMLTLDKTIQRTAQDALAQTVKSLRAEGGAAVAGAAVVADIQSGGVITAANYPTYDQATFNQNYEALTKDPAKPLTNRAFSGVYPIGSTIKPIVATAALENSLYHSGETVTCVHTYSYFDDYQPSCMGRHGAIALTTALSKSCNYFFFDLGRRVGAKSMTEYFKQFGLGVKTGVEVGDNAGLLVEPAGNGFGGDTLQIAIGQLNAFTPLQLANYTATLANGGSHYRATLIDKIVSYDLSEVYDDNPPEVLNTIPISAGTLSAVKAGMLSVTEDGTGRTTLGDYPIKVGGKTGTSQVTGQADHSVFIAFAPYENPKIAISVVLENGSSGFAAGTIVRNILDAYFFAKTNETPSTMPFVVLD